MPPSIPSTLPLCLRNRTHKLVLGKSGVGKSVSLAEIARAELDAGHGLLLVDPHGDLANEVLAALPRRRKNDLVRFEPAEPRCPGLDPFHLPATASPSLAVSSLLSVFENLFHGAWGARTEHLLRFAFLPLMGARNVSLLDARTILLDERRRASLLKRVTDPLVLDVWNREVPGYSKAFWAEISAAPLNKLGALLGHKIVREVVTRSRPKLDLARCLARQAVVIANLSKGTAVGDDGARLLGGLLLGGLEQAALGRAVLSPDARLPFTLIVDEVGSFTTASLWSLLAESRKYGISVVVAAQSLMALPPGARSALLANIGTLLAFRTSGEDAQILAPELGLELGPKTLTSLADHTAIVRSRGGRAVLWQVERTPAAP